MRWALQGRVGDPVVPVGAVVRYVAFANTSWSSTLPTDVVEVQMGEEQCR
jgi:hypothetical protein